MENPKHVHRALTGFLVLGSVGFSGLSLYLWDVWPIATWGLFLVYSAAVFAFVTVIFGLTIWPLVLLMATIFDRPSKDGENRRAAQ